MSKLTPEDFDVWQASHVTRALYRHVADAIKDCEHMWAGALKDPTLGSQGLNDLRIQLDARATVLHQMRNLTYEDLGNEPTTNVQNFPQAARSPS